MSYTFARRLSEVTIHCTMVDILAFVVFTALGSHTPPSDIQAGPLGHTGRPDIQSDLLSDSRASLTVLHQIQPIQPIQPIRRDQAQVECSTDSTGMFRSRSEGSPDKLLSPRQ